VNVGVIVYSWTGHTLSVATKLQEALSADGHAVRLERLETVGPVSPAATSAALVTVPAIDGHDALVLACGVQGGRPAVPMASYLAQVGSLADVRVAFLVTHFFPPQWGRDQALAQMQEMCASKGATVCGSGGVRWFGLRRGKRVAGAVERLRADLIGSQT
jgi:hypothetical protein